MFNSNILRQNQVRPTFQQPLSAELLSQQQHMIKQLQQHQAIQQNVVMTNSPKRSDITGNHRQQFLSQTIIHQTYGVPATLPVQQHPYQYQQSPVNLQQQLQASQLRQLSASSVVPSQSTLGRALPNPSTGLIPIQYYSQSNTPPQYVDVVHPLQVIYQMILTYFNFIEIVFFLKGSTSITSTTKFLTNYSGAKISTSYKRAEVIIIF